MLFISRENSPSFVMVQGVEEYSGGVRVRTKKPAVLYFEKLEQPFAVSHLPVKDGVARGRLLTKDAVAQLKRDGHVFTDEDGKDITEFSVIDFLFDHQGYGVDFVAVGTKTGEEILPKDRYIIEQPGESEFTHFCRLCRQNFRSLAGAEGHLSGKKHQELFQQAETNLWEKAVNQ